LRLLAGLALRLAKDKLCDQLPLCRDVPLLRNLGINEWVVVLKVGAETEGLEADPDCRYRLARSTSRNIETEDEKGNIRKYWCMALESLAQGSKWSL